jgi:hypothetical protein
MILPPQPDHWVWNTHSSGFASVDAIPATRGPAHYGPQSDDLQAVIEEYIQDKQKTLILAWLAIAKEALHIHALDTAVALFTKPEFSALAELVECRPCLTENYLKGPEGTWCGCSYQVFQCVVSETDSPRLLRK